MDATQLSAILKDFLTVKQAAVKLGIEPRAVQTACKLGYLRGAICLGREWRIPKSAIESRLKKHGKGPIPQVKRDNPLRKARTLKDLRTAKESGRKSPNKSKSLLRQAK